MHFKIKNHLLIVSGFFGCSYFSLIRISNTFVGEIQLAITLTISIKQYSVICK